MFDIITHTKDSQAFLAEVEAKFPDKVVHDEKTGKVPVSVLLTKTPTIRNGAETLAMVRCDAQELADIKTLGSVAILAEVPAYGDVLAAMTAAKRKIYDRVYPQAPQQIDDGQGGRVTYTPPALFGAFA